MRCMLRVSVSVVLWLAVAAFVDSLRAQSPVHALLPVRAVVNMGVPRMVMPIPRGQLTPSPNVFDNSITPGLSDTTADAAYRASDYVGRQLMAVRCGPFNPPKKGEFETTAEYYERYQRALQQHDEGCKGFYKAMGERGQQILNTIYTEEVRAYLQYDADQEMYNIRPCGFMLAGRGSARMVVRNPITANNPGIVVVNDVAMHSPITAINKVSGLWFVGIDCSLHVGRAEAPQWRANAERLRLRLSFRVGAMDAGLRMPVPAYLRELELYFVSFSGTARTLFLWRAD